MTLRDFALRQTRQGGPDAKRIGIRVVGHTFDISIFEWLSPYD
jgi:hypothetical protein